MDALVTLLNQEMQRRGLDDDTHRKRLSYELEEITIQEDFDYFWNLYQKKTRYPQNEHNLLVPFLLDIVDDFDINREAAWVMGELPDVDLDFLSEIQDYIKHVWAPGHFGRECVCDISTYGTLGIKSASLDMARVHGYAKDEIQAITVRMEDKDDDGKPLEWDKALELYPEFQAYMTAHPDVAASVQMLLDRYRSAGVHAGGMIIAKCRIDDFVPLEVRSVNKDNPKGVIVSAWTEGQATQDLQPVGLIKFDILVVNGLMQYSLGAKLVKERHGLPNVCGFEGDRDWTDTTYLDDPKAIAMANKGDLVGIFQFDTEGLRKVVNNGGVSKFDDLVAYSSLWRPGPLSAKMDKTFCERKKNPKSYKLHPILRPILRNTYGVMCFQEQVMQILNVVGKIPLIHCEKVRKAISKKKVEQFIKYKDMFIENGQKTLGISKEEIEKLWEQIVFFSGYGFNKCVAGDMLVKDKVTGKFISVKELADLFDDEQVHVSLDSWREGNIVTDDLQDAFFVREDELLEVELDNMVKIRCTKEHKFLCSDNAMHEMREIIDKSLEIICLDDI